MTDALPFITTALAVIPFNERGAAADECAEHNVSCRRMIIADRHTRVEQRKDGPACNQLEQRYECTVKNNIFWQSNGLFQIRWGSGTIYSNLSDFVSGESNGSGCLHTNPLYLSASDFHLQGASPAIDAGLAPASLGTNVYQLFQDLYGLNIQVDKDGGYRPTQAAWDIGAYEYHVPVGNANRMNVGTINKVQ